MCRVIMDDYYAKTDFTSDHICCHIAMSKTGLPIQVE